MAVTDLSFALSRPFCSLHRGAMVYSFRLSFLRLDNSLDARSGAGGTLQTGFFWGAPTRGIVRILLEKIGGGWAGWVGISSVVHEMR